MHLCTDDKKVKINIYMKTSIMSVLSSLVLFSCSNENSRSITPENSDTSKTRQENTIGEKYPDSVLNKSFSVGADERFLKLEIVVNKPLDSVWSYFSTAEGIKSWMAPICQLDFRVGGQMKNHMNYKKKIGDPGTLTLDILNYIPNEMVTYKVHMDNYFGERVKKEAKNIQEVVRFASVDKNRTKIISTMMGWGSGSEWDKAYAFFEKGNTWYFNVMVKRIKAGPIYWPNDP